METLEQLFNQRLTKLAAARRAGNPYQAVYQRDGAIQDLLAEYQDGQTWHVAGRLTALRTQGKISFADVRDSSGKIQLFMSEEALGEKYALITDALDLGDIVAAAGETFTTKRGEKTVRVSDLMLLAKALRPPPEKFHGLQNVELKYRQRYLDLMANAESREKFLLRSRVVSGIRRFLDEWGFLEVETPMMQPIPGGAAGKPFKTHHNALGLDLYLRIAPELYLKRLLVGGLDKVYELNRNFRNEGISTRHNPEFTMLEVYESYGSCASMMALTEELITGLAQNLLGTLQIPYAGKTIDLTRPWKKFSFASHMEKEYGIRPTDAAEEWVKKISAKGMKLDLPAGKKLSRTWLLNFIAELFEPIERGDASEGVSRPTFVVDYFMEFSPLAKAQSACPELADRFELFIGGMEVANAYSEQNDPIEQRRRLEAYADVAKDYSQAIDTDFLEALEHGMPPAGGLGIGIDRLAMLLTGQDTIRDVILFPTLRPEENRG